MTRPTQPLIAFLLCLIALLPACVPPRVPAEQVPKLSVGVLLFEYDPETVAVTAKQSQEQAEQQQQAQATAQQSNQQGNQQGGQANTGTKKEEKLVLNNPERVHESIRRAESYYLADLMRQEIEASAYFDVVKVAPDETEFFDIILATRIVRSNGHDFEIQVTAIDSRQKIWLKRKSYEIEELSQFVFSQRKNSQGKEVFTKDPYDPVFKEVIEDLEKATPRTAPEFDQIKRVTSLRYASDISPAAFPESKYIGSQSKKPGAVLAPVMMPNDADPSYQRVRQAQASEERALGLFGKYYNNGYKSVQMPYYFWRKDNRTAVEYYKDVKRRAAWEKTKAILGAVLHGGVIIAQGDNAEETIALSIEVFSRMMEPDGEGGFTFNPAFISPELRKMYDDAVEKEKMTEELSKQMTELGEAFANHVEPMTLEINGRTQTLSGKVDEQFVKLRDLLRQDYADQTGFPVSVVKPEASPVLPRVQHARDVNNK